MAHAHSDHDAVLAAFLEQGPLPDIAKRVNMSLASLANWAAEHAQLLANVHTLLVTRCKLIAAQLELAALSSLAAVSSSPTPSTDDKLRERALERQRKAANAILRHRASLERTGGKGRPAPSPRSAAKGVLDSVDDDEGRSANAGPSLDASMPLASMPSSSRSPRAPKPSLADRIAMRRLAAVQPS